MNSPQLHVRGNLRYLKGFWFAIGTEVLLVPGIPFGLVCTLEEAKFPDLGENRYYDLTVSCRGRSAHFPCVTTIDLSDHDIELVFTDLLCDIKLIETENFAGFRASRLVGGHLRHEQIQAEFNQVVRCAKQLKTALRKGEHWERLLHSDLARRGNGDGGSYVLV